MSLQFYLQDTSALMRDQRFLFSSQAQMVRWINEARRDIAKRTGCLRVLVTGQSGYGAGAQPGYFMVGGAQPGSLPDALNAEDNSQIALDVAQNSIMTIPGLERYSYEGFFNPLIRAQYAGVKGIIDTISVAINWGGNFRPALNWLAWDDLQAYCRAYANQTTSYPSVWSVYRDGEQGEIWLFPVPSQANEMEIDAFCVPSDIYSDTDVDAIPEGFREAVKYRAASLAFMASQRFQQAEMMEQLFASTLGIDSNATDRGKTPTYYWSRY